MRPDRKLVVGSIIEQKTHINRSGDESEQWPNSGTLRPCKSSPRYRFQSTITSTTRDFSFHEGTLWQNAKLPLSNVRDFLLHKSAYLIGKLGRVCVRLIALTVKCVGRFARIKKPSINGFIRKSIAMRRTSQLKR